MKRLKIMLNISMIFMLFGLIMVAAGMALPQDEYADLANILSILFGVVGLVSLWLYRITSQDKADAENGYHDD